MAEKNSKERLLNETVNSPKSVESDTLSNNQFLLSGIFSAIVVIGLVVLVLLSAV